MMNIRCKKKFSLLIAGVMYLCIATTATAADSLLGRATLDKVALSALIGASIAGATYYQSTRLFAHLIEIDGEARKGGRDKSIQYKRLAQEIRELNNKNTVIKMSLWGGALSIASWLSAACVDKAFPLINSSPIYSLGSAIAAETALFGLTYIGLSGISKYLPFLSLYEGGEERLEHTLEQKTSKEDAIRIRGVLHGCEVFSGCLALWGSSNIVLEELRILEELRKNN